MQPSTSAFSVRFIQAPLYFLLEIPSYFGAILKHGTGFEIQLHTKLLRTFVFSFVGVSRTSVSMSRGWPMGFGYPSFPFLPQAQGREPSLIMKNQDNCCICAFQNCFSVVLLSTWPCIYLPKRVRRCSLLRIAARSSPH